MAIIMGQKKNMNDAIGLALNMAMNQNLMGQRQQGAMDLETYRTQNDAGLKQYQSALDLQKALLEGEIKTEQAGRDWAYKVSLLSTRREQLIAMAPLGDEAKKHFGADIDVDAISKEIQRMDDETASGLAETLQGRLSGANIKPILANQPKSLDTALSQGGQSWRQNEMYPLEQRKVAATEAGVRNEGLRLTQEDDKLGRERRKSQVDILDKIDSVLNAQGVRAEGGILDDPSSAEKLGRMIVEGGALKSLDPMDPETTGKLRQVINTLRWKLTNEDLTPQEEALIPALSNFAAIRTGGIPGQKSAGASALTGAGGASVVASASPYKPVAGAGSPGQKDAYGFMIGETKDIPSGPNAGTWRYNGNNSWTKIK